MTPEPLSSPSVNPSGSVSRAGSFDLFDRLPVAALRVGADGRVWRLNPAAAAIFGRAEAVEGTAITLLLPGLELRRERSFADESWFGQIPSPEPRWVEVVATRAPASAGPGVLDDWLLVVRDVTGWVAREQTRDEILALVAHELRTPLATLRGFSENLADSIEGPVNERQRAILERMIRTSRRATRLLEGILEGARCRAGRDVLDVSAFSVDRVVRDVADALRAGASEKSLSIGIEVEPGLPDVESDPGKIEQVLSNLVTNSVKYTPRSGSITIRATRPEQGVLAIVSRLDDRPHPAAGDLVQLTVEDNGIGIAPEDVERVFERYARSKTASEPGIPSYGLGLWICRDIVTRLGGRICVQSEVGKGTRVSVLIPRVHAQAGGGSGEDRGPVPMKPAPRTEPAPEARAAEEAKASGR